MFRKITRAIAEVLFTYELDEDYNLGLREGQRATLSSAILRLKVARNQDVKKNNPGLDKAIELLKELR